MAFTLIEILVVIAIIGLIAAILFPVFTRARETARRASCASNLKQIGYGLLLYVQDFDERAPLHAGAPGGLSGGIQDYTTSSRTNPWRAIYPYVKNWRLFRCPSAVESTITSVASCADASTTPANSCAPRGNNDNSYLVNMVAFSQPIASQIRILKMSSIADTSQIIWVQEDAFASRTLWPRPVVDSIGGNYRGFDWLISLYNVRHFNGGNLLFCDGHVKWRQPNAIKAEEYGLSCGGIYTGPQTPTSNASNPLPRCGLSVQG